MLMKSIKDIASACGGKALNCDDQAYVNVFVTNDCEVVENCVYVAIEGEKHDGNEFAGKALSKGAAIILTEKEPVTDIPCIVVSDVKKALIDISRFVRDKRLRKAVLVTGSVGKTTVKELIWSVLSQRGAVLKTKGNMNNTLGLPLTLLSNTDSEIAVIEAGISEVGEMERLSYACSPDVVVITNIGVMHASTLGTKEVTAKEKLKSLTHAKDGCLCVIPHGEPLLHNTDVKTVSVGIDEKNADFSAENIHLSENGSNFDLIIRNRVAVKDLFVPIIGIHGVIDALFACAVAFELGINERELRVGLSRYKSEALRQNIIDKNAVTVMLDCYNSGPESLGASVDAFDILCKARRIKNSVLMLGSMLELGDISESEHIRIGKLIALKGFSELITLGDQAKNIALGALCGKMSGKISVFADNERDELCEYLKKQTFKDCAVLIKGSRKMKMEELLPFVIKEEQ